jgi:hypothetical protein
MRSGTQIRVIVQWPNGSRLPVRIEEGQTVRDLEKMLRFAVQSESEVRLFAGTRRLDRDTELNEQEITFDSVLIAKMEPKGVKLREADKRRILTKEIEDLYRESLRLSDIRLHRLTPSAEREIELEESSSYDNLFDETFLEPSGPTIPIDALPMPWEDDSDYSDDPDSDTNPFSRFSSVKEARHYFSEEKPFGWTW